MKPHQNNQFASNIQIVSVDTHVSSGNNQVVVVLVSNKITECTANTW